MDPEQTIHDLRKWIRRVPNLRNTLEREGSITLLENGKAKLRAVREDAGITLEMTKGPAGYSFVIKEKEDSVSIQVVENDGDGNLVTTTYEHGDLANLFGTPAYVDIIEAALKKVKSETIEEFNAEEIKYVEFALASQDPSFFSIYSILLQKRFQIALESKGFEIKNVRTFTDLERLAKSTSVADSYIIFVDANLDERLLNKNNQEYFRIYHRIPGYDYPAQRLKKKGKSLCILVQDQPLPKELVREAGYDRLADRVRTLSTPKRTSL